MEKKATEIIRESEQAIRRTVLEQLKIIREQTGFGVSDVDVRLIETTTYSDEVRYYDIVNVNVKLTR